MLPDEITALGELAGEAGAGTAVQIYELHRGIAERVWRAVGPAAAPVRAVHDQVARGAYAFARELTRGAVRAGALAYSVVTPRDAPSLEASRLGRAVVSAVNGAWGDALVRRRNGLAVRTTVRLAGRDVPVDRDGLRSAYVTATPRLAVFIHGLCQNDEAWTMFGSRHVPYGFRLQSELGYTPIYVRYNTGRHISENGRDLAELLEQLVAAWPAQVHEVALFGHSMGGLVARSACHYGAGSEWTSKVRHVFTLGSPHAGAPLEQATNAATAALARLPETRGIAKALNIRSAGIKDLRYGYLVDDDWFGHDCDAYLRRAASEIPFLPKANHYFVCATLSPEPLGRIVGDLLVLRASAWAHGGRGERMRFPVDHYTHVGGANHFDLLNHPAIYWQIRRWLTSRKALPAPSDECPES